MVSPRGSVCACWYSFYAQVDKTWRIVNAAYLDGTIDQTRRARATALRGPAPNPKKSPNREVPGEMS